ncbi:MAG TPA: T9SS type A sorting domain-containing protein, partial [Bacteroidota bacterium]|nr:T9SS type A sorting domain-containing protein [Bacteroidota bacterium]
PDTFWFYADRVGDVVDLGNGIPAEYALHQNYPNPFNPSTVMQFDLPRAATVTLSVYNILGQEVVRLMDKESMNAGYKKVIFDASGIPSGAYLYRVFAEDNDGKTFVSVKRMILVK